MTSAVIATSVIVNRVRGFLAGESQVETPPPDGSKTTACARALSMSRGRGGMLGRDATIEAASAMGLRVDGASSNDGRGGSGGMSGSTRPFFRGGGSVWESGGGGGFRGKGWMCGADPLGAGTGGIDSGLREGT